MDLWKLNYFLQIKKVLVIKGTSSVLTLYCKTSQSGQAHFKALAAFIIYYYLTSVLDYLPCNVQYTSPVYGVGRYALNCSTTKYSHCLSNKAKGRVSKGMFQENKTRQIFRKMNISYPLIRTRTYQGVRNVRFSENLAWFVFLKHLFWDSRFCLITNDWNYYSCWQKW